MPTVFLLICTLYAGWIKVFSDNPKFGFLAIANKFSTAMESGKLIAPAKSMEEMSRLVFNNRLDAGLTLFFMFVIISVVGFGLRAALKSLRSDKVVTTETAYVAMAAV